MGSRAKDIAKLIRPQQWVKNLFILLPIFFGHRFDHPGVWPRMMLLFAIFSLTASSIYVFNDICDRAIDRLHPIKKNRPIASGRLSLASAYTLELLLLVGAFSLVWLAPYTDRAWYLSGALVGVYLLLNLVYSLRGKHWPVIDAFFVASGFVLRVEAGGIVAQTPVSHWLFLMVLFLSLLLAFGKRQEDINLATKSNETTRPVVNRYSTPFLQSVFGMIAAILIVLYTLYCLDETTMQLHSPYLYTTVPLVALGLLYYLRRVVVDGRYCNPTDMLFHDHGLQLIALSWALLFFLLSYVF